MKLSVWHAASVALLFAIPASSTPVFSVTGTVDANPSLTNDPGLIDFLTDGWIQTVGISDATITAQINGTGTITAFLTNEIGPGTTQAANQIASSTFTVTNAPQSNTETIFTGLTLGPGTYFLTLYQSVANQGEAAAWVGDRTPVITGSPEFTPLAGEFGGSFVGGIDSTYIPASLFEANAVDFQSEFQLLAISTPDLSTYLTSSTGLLLLAGFSLVQTRRRRGQVCAALRPL